MEFKKTQAVIIFFLVLWIAFIAWGLVKTTFQLSKQKAAPPETTTPQQKTSEVIVEQTPEETKDTLIRVRTIRVEPTDFTDLLPVMGTVKGETEMELKFEVEGIIKSINFREGEKVKRGDLIACLDPTDARLKLEYTRNKLSSAQAAYQSALKQLEIHKMLYEAGAIIKSKLEEIELDCESARYQWETVKSEEELAQSELEKTNLFAPMDGVMGPREAEEGEFITPQDRIGSLLEIDNIMVEVGIVERDINKIKLGQRANVYVDAYPDITFQGVVDNIFPVVEGKSRTLTARIKVDNPRGLLLPGMFCRAEILIVELKDAFIVPSTSLIPSTGKTLFLPVIPAHSIEVDEDEIKTGTVRLRYASVGYLTSDYAHITAGLNEGDLVVTEAQGELQDNAKVRISAIEEMAL